MGDRWSDMLDELTHQRVELDRVGSALAQVTARGTSADRLVSVTVDARGRLVDLTIDPRAMRRYRADHLALQITELVAEADQTLMKRRNHLLSEAVQASPDYADVRSTDRS